MGGSNYFIHNAPVSNAAYACATSITVGGRPVGELALRDAAAIEQGYKDFQARFSRTGMMDEIPIVPRTVGHNGAAVPGQEAQVQGMLSCMGELYGVQPGVLSELKGMYSDSVALERRAHARGLHTH